MLVFTDEWIQQVREENERPGISFKPFVYPLATRDEYKTMREKIETWISSLPQPSQEALIPKLRLLENIDGALDELIIGYFMIMQGYQVEYEKAFSNLTPDWYVKTNIDVPNFVIELFSKDISKAKESQLKQVGELTKRLQQIQCPIVLNMQIKNESIILNQKINKEIAYKVEQWLVQHNPHNDEYFELHGISFIVGSHDNELEHLLVLGPFLSDMVNPIPLRVKIEQKIRRYKEIILSEKLPFVIGASADFLTALGIDDLTDVLYGTCVLHVRYNKATKEILERRNGRKNNGLFAEKPLLSAVIWLVNYDFDKWKISIFHNPNARYPLPESTFNNCNI
jgi:hypothetical protein